jgi:hypothetical protein
MTTAATIRPERAADRYARGLVLIRAIRSMWDRNSRLVGSDKGVDDGIKEIMEEFDLTLVEWHYWCSAARSI